MTIGEQIKERLSKDVYRAAQARRGEINVEAVADDLVALHQKAFDTGALTDAELTRAAELFETLHGAGAVREFDETWSVLSASAAARVRVADLTAARANWHGLVSQPRNQYTSAEVSQADTRLRVASMARDELQELSRRHPLLVAPFVEDVAAVA